MNMKGMDQVLMLATPEERTQEARMAEFAWVTQVLLVAKRQESLDSSHDLEQERRRNLCLG